MRKTIIVYYLKLLEVHVQANCNTTLQDPEAELLCRCLREAELERAKFNDKVERASRVCGHLPLSTLDRISVLFMIFHCSLLALYGTWDEHALFEVVSTLFSLMYCAEVMVRIHALGGFSSYLNSPRGETHTLRNKAALYLSAVGITATALYWAVDSSQQPLPRAFMAAQLFRLFFMAESLAGIVNSFLQGLQPIAVFCLLLLLVFYEFSLFAYLFLHGRLEHGDFDYNSLVDTCLTMFQVFMGAGWSDVMTASVIVTNKALVWFFVGFVLITSILFTQLFVGIIIGVFQTGEEDRRTMTGQVQLAFRGLCGLMPEDEQQELLFTLGKVALKMRTLHENAPSVEKNALCSKSNEPVGEVGPQGLTQSARLNSHAKVELFGIGNLNQSESQSPLAIPPY